MTDLDAVTGIPTRRAFFALLNDAMKPNAGIAVILANVDHMKKVNGLAGHVTGNSVLWAVAQVFAKRLGDRRCCRYGGNDFAAIALCPGRAEVLGLAESLRAEVAGLSFETYPELRVTVRLGVAIWPEDGDSVEELMRSADQAIDQAKCDGGNCVRLKRDEAIN